MLLFLDGWDHLATSDLPLVYSGGSPGTVNAGAGRFVGSSFTPNSASRNLTVNLVDDVPAGLIVGFACINPTGTILSIATNVPMVSIKYVAGAIQVLDASNGVIAQTPAGLIQPGVWFYLEVMIAAWGEGSTVSIQFNGSAQGSGTGNTGTPNAGDLSLFTYTWESGAGTVDDNYWFDTSAGSESTFAGVRRVDTRYPSGNGRVNTWTPVGVSAPNSNAVKDPTPDYDATYVKTNTAGALDCYTVAAPSVDPASVAGVQIDVCARSDGTEAVKFYVGVGNGESEQYPANGSIPNTNYEYYFDVLDSNPFTSAAWAPADVDTLQIAIINANVDGSS